MKFNENLLKYRKIKGLTQEEMAEKMQVSRQSVSKWENGEAVPELAKIIKIADVLGISMDELCGRNAKNDEDSKNSKSESVDKQIRKINNRSYLIAIIIISMFCGFCGYFIGYSGKNENNIVSEVYQLPDSIDVTGVTFELENAILTCGFVPEIYSDKLIYNVTIIDYDGGKKSDMVTFEGGVGKVHIPVEDSQYYKVVLEITNGEESRNVTLADKLYVNNKNNMVTLH